MAVGAKTLKMALFSSSPLVGEPKIWAQLVYGKTGVFSLQMVFHMVFPHRIYGSIAERLTRVAMLP